MASPDTRVMRAVILQMPEHWIAERRMTGEDRRDECWDGVLHVSPQPTTSHQGLGMALLDALKALADARGWRRFYEISVFDPDPARQKNWRVPDVSLVAPEHFTERGIEARAELVIEILSPHDESRDKFDYYARCGIPEVWLVDPHTRVPEVYVLAGASYITVQPDATGALAAPSLGLALSAVAGPKLRITSPAGTVEI